MNKHLDFLYEADTNYLDNYRVDAGALIENFNRKLKECG